MSLLKYAQSGRGCGGETVEGGTDGEVAVGVLL